MSPNRLNMARTLRGGRYPRAYALAVALGLPAGMVAGWNLTLLVMLILVAILDVHTRTFLRACLVGIVASWLLAPVTFVVGQWLLDVSPVGWVLGAFGEGPWVALLAWDRYVVIGGLATGSLLGMPASWLVLSWSRRHVTSDPEVEFQAVAEPGTSPQSEPVRGRYLTRMLLADLALILFGIVVPRSLVLLAGNGIRHAGHVAREQVRYQTNYDPLQWLRPNAVMCGIAGVVVGTALVWWMAPRQAARALLASLQNINRAEVTAEQCVVSLSSGSLEIRNLCVADPTNATRDRLRVARITGQIHPGALLRGRLEVDELRVEGMDVDLPRRTAARLATLPQRGIDTAPARLQQPAPSATDGVFMLKDHVAHWPAMRNNIAWVRNAVNQLNMLSICEAPGPPADGMIEQWNQLRSMRSELGLARPRLLVERLRADELPSAWNLGPKAKLELARISSAPQLVIGATTLEITAPARVAELRAELNLHDPERPHEVDFTVYDVDLPELLRANGEPFTADAGSVEIRGVGQFDNRSMHVMLNITIDDLTATFIDGETVAGLPANLWTEALAQTRRLQVEATLHGSFDAPHLAVDERHLIRHLRYDLVSAGRADLADEIALHVSNPTVADSAEGESLETPEAIARRVQVVAKPPATSEPLDNPRATRMLAPLSDSAVVGDDDPRRVDTLSDAETTQAERQQAEVGLYGRMIPDRAGRPTIEDSDPVEQVHAQPPTDDNVASLPSRGLQSQRSPAAARERSQLPTSTLPPRAGSSWSQEVTSDLADAGNYASRADQGFAAVAQRSTPPRPGPVGLVGGYDVIDGPPAPAAVADYTAGHGIAADESSWISRSLRFVQGLFSRQSSNRSPKQGSVARTNPWVDGWGKTREWKRRSSDATDMARREDAAPFAATAGAQRRLPAAGPPATQDMPAFDPPRQAHSPSWFERMWQ